MVIARWMNPLARLRLQLDHLHRGGPDHTSSMCLLRRCSVSGIRQAAESLL